MGSTYANLRNAESRYRNVTFGDAECVKALLKFRTALDVCAGDRSASAYQASGTAPFNTEIVCLYADLDRLIDRCRLSGKQRDVIERLMDGWREEEIAREYRQQVSRIYAIVDTVCDKIKRENDLAWKHEYVYANYFVVGWGKKRCAACGNVWPLHEDFYRKRVDGKGDGYYNKCRRCGR